MNVLHSRYARWRGSSALLRGRRGSDPIARQQSGARV